MMQLMATAFTSPHRVTEDQMRRDQMKRGYPITTEPFVPDIMKHKVEYKMIECKKGFRKVAFVLAPTGSELVEPESLEMIRKKLWAGFQRNFPELASKLETTLPRNTIAVCFSERHFNVGTFCQEFFPTAAFKTSEESFLTYQKLSENVQVTYYNQNGSQFLAGVCYYPVPNGEAMYLKNDDALIYLARMSSEEYPLCDRSKSFKKVNYNMYGVYCKSAGKRVLVDCREKYGANRHLDFNHFTDEYENVTCTECLEDATIHTLEESKEEAPVPVTRHPNVPDSLKHTVDWKTWVSKEGRPLIGFTQAAEDLEFATPECLEMFKTEIANWLGNFPEFSQDLEKALPRNTIAVSFAQDNFQVGKSCPDFLPYDKSEVPDEAFYTYQMISKNVQATYYNENGVEFLAGVCWYLPSNGNTISLNRDLKLMNLARFCAEPFPLQDRNKSFNKINHDIYGRYCKTAGKRVAVNCNVNDGRIRHFGVNLYTNSWEYTPCKECEDDHYNYKWAEPKREEPGLSATSSAASSDSFLEDYDQIENTENFTESDKEFDADVIY